MVITLYFGNSELNPDLVDCSLVYPVVRVVPAVEDPVRLTLELLFAGPTEPEAAEGYVSSFSSETAGILRNVEIHEDGTAYVDLIDIQPLVPYASTSCGSAAFLAEVEATLKQQTGVKRVIFAIEGNPKTFYEWIQYGCGEFNDFCDPTPFQESDAG